MVPPEPVAEINPRTLSPSLAILLMAFFVLLIAFNKTEKGGAQMTAGSEEGNFGVQNELPVVSRPKGESAIAKSFSPAQVDRTLVKIVREVTTDIRPPKDTPLTRLNRENRFKRNAEIEMLEEALAKEIATNRVRVIAGKFKTTFLFIIFGSFLIFFINVLRISIIAIALYEYPQYEYIFHDIIFPVIIYGVTFLLWVIWVVKFSKLR